MNNLAVINLALIKLKHSDQKEDNFYTKLANNRKKRNHNNSIAATKTELQNIRSRELIKDDKSHHHGEQTTRES